MPSMQVVIEATSPLINYDNGWAFGTSTDQLADQYTISSFGVTQKDGATATLSFRGTSVTVVGAKRFNHGPYKAQIDNDNTTLVNGNGVSPDTPLFNQTLYSWTGPVGDHTLSFSNVGTSFLDIDYILVSTPIGLNKEQLITQTSQEDAFQYLPAESWTPSPFAGSFSGGAGMQTTDPNAIARFEFVGDGIALHGPVGAGYAVLYSVQMDNKPLTTFKPALINPNTTMPRELLYMATGLGAGVHTLVLQLQNAPAGQALGIDFVDVFTTQSIESSVPSLLSSSFSELQSSITKLKLAVGLTSAIAGIAIIALCFVLLSPRFLSRARRSKEFGKVGPVRPDTPTPFRLATQNQTPIASAFLSSALSPSGVTSPGTTYNPYDAENGRLIGGSVQSHEDTSWGGRLGHRTQDSVSSGFGGTSPPSDAGPLSRSYSAFTPSSKQALATSGESRERSEGRAPPAYSPLVSPGEAI